MASKKAGYNVVYTVNSYKAPKPVEWIKKNGLGGADAVLLVAIYRDGESLDMKVMTIDGDTQKPLKDEEVFNVWGALARHLSENSKLPVGAAAIVSRVWDIFRNAVASKAKKMTKGFLS
jgi:hypothetical protein